MDARLQRHAAQHTRCLLGGVLLAGFVVLVGCSRGGDSRAFLRVPQEPGARSSGCVDTPFIGSDLRSGAGISCGRERSPEAALVHGRVVSEELGGLPGAGIEGVWVTIHPLDDRPAGLDPLGLRGLPPASAQAQTDPQGSFVIAVGPHRAAAYLIAVRLELDGAPLTARRIEGEGTDWPAQLVLLVPRAESRPPN